MRFLLPVATLATAANAYFLASAGPTSHQRLDLIVNPGNVSSHAHIFFGGSHLRSQVTTASLQQSTCTSYGVLEDKSLYWFPQLYFAWKNGSFSSVTGQGVFYYLFSNTPGTVTAFPNDFRMISGDPTLRSYDPTSFAQQAVSFLCLDFQGTTTKYTGFPDKPCPSGIRSQLNFQSCWDGKNLDSADHKSHVDYLSGGPDSGTCSNPKYPVTLPRIFTEIYWSTPDFEKYRDQAANPNQPFVFAQGDDTGYGQHGDFYMGWDRTVLQKTVDECHCNNFGDLKCCADQGILTLTPNQNCHVTDTWDEQILGTLDKLPGNNPIQHGPQRATMYPNNYVPGTLSPIYEYIGDTPPGQGTVVVPGHSISPGNPTSSSTPASSPTSPSVKLAVPNVDSLSSLASDGTGPSPSPSVSSSWIPSQSLPTPSDGTGSSPSPSVPSSWIPSQSLPTPSDGTRPSPSPSVPSSWIPSQSQDQPTPAPTEMPEPEDPGCDDPDSNTDSGTIPGSSLPVDLGLSSQLPNTQTADGLVHTPSPVPSSISWSIPSPSVLPVDAPLPPHSLNNGCTCHQPDPVSSVTPSLPLSQLPSDSGMVPSSSLPVDVVLPSQPPTTQSADGLIRFPSPVPSSDSWPVPSGSSMPQSMPTPHPSHSCHESQPYPSHSSKLVRRHYRRQHNVVF